jgi:hypothetical protein
MQRAKNQNSALSMRVLRHFCSKKRMDIARMLLALLVLSGTQHALAQAPIDPPPPPRIVDAPVPSATSPRPAVRSATPSPAPVVPTLEQSLVPDAKPLPADPTQRALENARRAVPPQGKSREAAAAASAAKLDRVEVEALRPNQRDPVKEAFDRNLPPPKRTGVEEVMLDNGARCITNHDCGGPFCTRVCTAGNGTLGNQVPGGFSLY